MVAQYQYYLWLASTILSAGRITREEINRRWAYSSINEKHDTQITERTFHNWRHGAESILNIIIDCDKRNGNVYYISDAESLRKDQSRRWMLDSFSISSLVKNADLSEYVLLESMPSDAQFLMPIMDAIRNRKVLSVHYKRFDAPERTFTMQPYCVKNFKRRWYMVGLSSDHPDEVRTYALDRILFLQILDRSYTIPASFNAQNYFKHCYGIFGAQEQPRRVVVEVNEKEVQYLRTLPLHPSQKEIPHSTLFEFYLVPSFDFIQELRTFGASLKVIEPQSLAEQFKQLGQDYLQLYS